MGRFYQAVRAAAVAVVAVAGGGLFQAVTADDHRVFRLTFLFTRGAVIGLRILRGRRRPFTGLGGAASANAAARHRAITLCKPLP